MGERPPTEDHVGSRISHRTCYKSHDVGMAPRGPISIVQIIELLPAPVASETGVKLLEQIESGFLRSLALHACLRIYRFESGQGLLHDTSHLIVGERAAPFERKQRAEAQHE